jgi:Zn-dependent M28 family amino/carboxypeptidase
MAGQHWVAAEGPRSVWSDGLDRSVVYLLERIREAGAVPALHTYEISGTPVSNIEVDLIGAVRPREIVLVGAHYDTVDETPGADDNASGVAVALELLRLAVPHRTERTLRFVFFVNEEPPYFQTDRMGSLVYADRARARGDNIVAMLSIESVGFYSAEQSYPPPIGLLYPSTGDFIAFVGDLSSRSLVRRSIAAFRSTGALPSEGLAAPSWIPGVSWSDHWSFSANDYPAVMVTATALFRNPHYHEATDTPEKLDYRRMALLVQGLRAVLAELSRAEDQSARRPRGSDVVVTPSPSGAASAGPPARRP